MYTITEERANELMLMQLTVRRETDMILADRADDDKWYENVRVLDELIDTQMDYGILETYAKAKSISTHIRERGERKTHVILMLKAMECIADSLIRGIE
jgi:hypothetical protein